jgi:uncharacterized protein with HEPN domain
MSSKRKKTRTPPQAVHYARLQISRINEWTASLTSESFESDQRTRYAVERAFIALGEAIKDLARGMDLAAVDPSGPWREPARFRDFLAHDYDDQVIPLLMWKTITTDLMTLDEALARVERIVGRYDPTA